MKFCINSGRYGRKMTDSDDDMPVLSDYAQQALQQFLAEQQAAAQIEQEMLEQGEDNKKAEVELKEDWQLRKRGFLACSKSYDVTNVSLSHKHLVKLE